MVLNVPQSGIEVLIITGHMGERDTETALFQAWELFQWIFKDTTVWLFNLKVVAVCLLSLGKNLANQVIIALRI